MSKKEGLNIEIAEQYLVFDGKIWKTGKGRCRPNGCHDITKLQLIPILNTQDKMICYDW